MPDDKFKLCAEDCGKETGYSIYYHDRGVVSKLLTIYPTWICDEHKMEIGLARELAEEILGFLKTRQYGKMPI
jgi:hypothetical protein